MTKEQRTKRKQNKRVTKKLPFARAMAACIAQCTIKKYNDRNMVYASKEMTYEETGITRTRATWTKTTKKTSPSR